MNKISWWKQLFCNHIWKTEKIEYLYSRGYAGKIFYDYYAVSKEWVHPEDLELLESVK